MHLVVLRDPKTGKVTKAFNVADSARIVEYLDSGSPGLEVYSISGSRRGAALTLRRVQVAEATRVTESRTISADLEDAS